MQFQINFKSTVSEMMAGLVVDEPRPFVRGLIKIDSFEEAFFSPQDVWRASEYESQWDDAIRRLRNGLDACFVTAVHPNEIARYIECWIVWRLDTEFRVQNQCLFYDNGPIVDPHSPYSAIWPYRNVTEGGDRIHDDWRLPLDAFL